MLTRFRNRHEAGRALAAALMPMRREHPVIVALPRSGVPVAAAVAQALEAPLDIVVTRKLAPPGEPELAVGALAEGGASYIDPTAAGVLGISHEDLSALAESEAVELERRARMLRGERPPLDVEGRTVVVIDDGIARGASVRAALRSLRQRRPARMVVAAPVIAPDTLRELREECDEVVCLSSPKLFGAVGFWYQEFAAVTDEEVLALLAQSRKAAEPPAEPVEMEWDPWIERRQS
ncbi:MAG TPA: phosphoribosyltransferase family protein [Myxococcales bacterium]|nr:phosphoribosyltransferase family protein [Myxococcales bacterium]